MCVVADDEVCARRGESVSDVALVIHEGAYVRQPPVGQDDHEIGGLFRFAHRVLEDLDVLGGGESHNGRWGARLLLCSCARLDHPGREDVQWIHARPVFSRRASQRKCGRTRKKSHVDALCLKNQRTGRFFDVPARPHEGDSFASQNVQGVQEGVGTVVEHVVVRYRDAIDPQVMQIFHALRRRPHTDDLFGRRAPPRKRHL